MIDVRPFDTLGKADHGWLKARHHFSFGSHYDPARMGWGALRVWNDDAIAPRSGFPPMIWHRYSRPTPARPKASARPLTGWWRRLGVRLRGAVRRSRAYATSIGMSGSAPKIVRCW